MPALTACHRKFFSPDTDFANPGEVKNAFATVAAMPRNTPEELALFVETWMEVIHAVDEISTRYYVAMTGDTTDKVAETGYLHMVEKVRPLVEEENDRQGRLFLQSPAVEALGPAWLVMVRDLKKDVEIFREENIPLNVENAKLSKEYRSISGAWTVEWEGRTLPVPQVMAKLNENDRDLRRSAYLKATAPHLQDAARLDDLFDRMLHVRGNIAKNAGFPDFRAYSFKAKGRFDYTPEDCLSFHRAIETTVTPVVGMLNRRRAQAMGIPAPTVYDLSADPWGRPAMRPFSDAAELSAKVHRVLADVDGELAGFFQMMRDEKLLDLESRPGKAPGGYMAGFAERRLPFIFMNAAGTARNVDTLLHESGHACHLCLSRHLSDRGMDNPPMEFAEVASMSMELLARPFFHHVYRDDELDRVKQEQLEGVLRFLPFMAMIDAFQHWVYRNPSTPDSRAAYWMALEERFRPDLSWQGVEDRRAISWQYLHVFQVPFYYIEYGIAQMGALQVWQNSLKDYPGAVRRYKQALALGGSAPLPQLFSAAGGRFDMGADSLKGLVEAVVRELSL